MSNQLPVDVPSKGSRATVTGAWTARSPRTDFPRSATTGKRLPSGQRLADGESRVYHAAAASGTRTSMALLPAW